jgi:hypothetical protein
VGRGRGDLLLRVLRAPNGRGAEHLVAGWAMQMFEASTLGQSTGARRGEATPFRTCPCALTERRLGSGVSPHHASLRSRICTSPILSRHARPPPLHHASRHAQVPWHNGGLK